MNGKEGRFLIDALNLFVLFVKFDNFEALETSSSTQGQDMNLYISNVISW